MKEDLCQGKMGKISGYGQEVIRMGTEPSTHPSVDGTFMNNYSKHGQVEGCGLFPGGAGEPWEISSRGGQALEPYD